MSYNKSDTPQDARGYSNGKLPCKSENEILQIKQLVGEQRLAIGELVEVVDERMTQLINVVAGKGMLPVESLKYIIICLLVFMFSMQFGVAGVKLLIESLR